MFQWSNSFYAQWRLRSGAATMLHDDRDSPPERLLQAIWQHQRVLRDQLVLSDGRPLRVLHPGFSSVEGGPDFRGAVLQIGDDIPRCGDIEVDIRPTGWRAHGHDRNPAFKSVVLHVVWESEESPRKTLEENRTAPPITLRLRHVLDAPLGELSFWLDCEPSRPLPEGMLGRCSPLFRELSRERLTELLREAARVRFEGKAARFRSRARQAGWEQALWEGLFQALGYKHNVWPMQCLAEMRPRWAADAVSPFVLQARLLGISGLLPADLSRSALGGDGYLRRVWDSWWRERDEFADSTLPRKLWRFHGLRPANHPQRRLALAAGWLTAGDLAARLQSWCADLTASESPPNASKALASLLKIMQTERDDYWSWHWTFRSKRLPQPQPLLGEARVTDLAVNVILPWLWSRADEGGNKALRNAIERCYFAWPPGEDNAVLRLARRRILHGAPRRALDGAAGQQGLMQIARDFCDRSNAICQNCPFPELAREYA